MNRAKSRTLAIEELLKKYKNNESINDVLLYGYIPEEIEEEYQILYKKYLEETKDSIDTDYDMSLYSNFFYLNDNKILGVEKQGTHHMDRLKTVGKKINDIDEIIPFVYQEGNNNNNIKNNKKDSDNNNETEKNKEKVKNKEEKQEEPKKNKGTKMEDVINSLTITKKIKEFESDQKKDENLSELITIEETLKLYSPNITDDEIRAYVYYKQRFGSPMFGWEKWFLNRDTKNVGTVCISNKNCWLLNPSYEQVKNVPMGSRIGIKTRFKNVYGEHTYWVIKTEDNELYIVKESDFDEIDSFATVNIEDIKDLVRKKVLFFDGVDYVPEFILTLGNIYEIMDKFRGKINKETNEFEGGYIEQMKLEFDSDVIKNQERIIDETIKSLSKFDFANPIKSKRPYLSKENELTQSISIKDVNSNAGFTFASHFYEYNKTVTKKNQIAYVENVTSFNLFKVFEIWLSYNVNNDDLKNTTTKNIQSFYIENKNIFLTEEQKKLSDAEQNAIKEEIRLNARIEGEKCFSEFLATALTDNDLKALNIAFNRKFNSFAPIKPHKVPVGFEVNRKIFNKDLVLNNVQRNGIAFINANNSGCLAYDVGFGKTLCAIHILASKLKQGDSKRPLIVVPKPVYKNWINELFGFWTDGKERSRTKFQGSYFVNGALTGTKYKLNTFFNLSPNQGVENKIVDEYSVSIVTYQGLEKIGFSDKIYNEIGDEFYKILNKKKEEGQSRGKQEEETESDNTVYDDDIDQEEYLNDNKFEKGGYFARGGKIKDENAKNIREEGKVIERVLSNLSKALYKTDYDIDELGFDFLILDEAHAYKNSFTSIDLPKDTKNEWRLTGGNDSYRAIKGFVMSLYIQKKYNGNVVMLTATPFTNSPLELFTMLYLVGYNYMINSELNNLYKFMSLFIQTNIELTVTHLQKFKLDTVIKSFKNKNILRDVFNRYFDFQDDVIKAGVKRPCLVELPTNDLPTILRMSNTQRKASVLIQEKAKEYSTENKGAIATSIAWAKSNSFSPYLVDGIEPFDDLDEFVRESPKIDYTIRCIKSVKQYHESLGQECSGQVIYSDRGKELFVDFKKALNNECGFKRKVAFGDDIVDEVEIIVGGEGNNEKSQDRREVVIDAFNKGYVKVIIGTSTIREGVNLQTRGTVLYDLDLDWNSSGIHQLKGRIHRQGNRFKFVRFVVPYVQNTLDSFIAQKNYEKNERIKSLWDKSDDLNEKNVSDEIDLMEIRFQLISDKKELYNVKYQIEHEKASKKLALYHQRLTAFEDGKKAVIKFLRTEMEMRELFNDKFIQFERYYEGLYNYFNDVIKNKVLKERFEKVKKSFDDFLESINEILDFYRLFIQKEDYKALSRFKNAIISRKLVFSYEPLNDGYIIEVDASTIYYKYHYSELYQNNRDLKVFVNNYYRIHDRFNEFQAELSAVQKFERDILRPYQKSFRDDFDDILIDLTINREQALKLTEYIESDDFYEESIIKIEDTLIERNEQLGDIQDRVDDFTSLNYLLSYPFEEKTADQCELPINTDEGKSERDKFQKERNKKNEDGDIEEGSERATRKKLRKIKDFFNKSQYKVVSANIMEFEEPIHRLFETISKMPVTYETESIEGNEKIACLHYFYGGTDIYIIELDKGDEEDTDDMFQAQTFGWTILNDDFEMSDYGYISIDEIKKHFELDFYFTPKKMAQIIDSHNPYLKKTKNDNDIDEVEYQEEEEENEDFDEEEQEAIKLQEESVRLINQEINLLNMKIENWESELEFVDSESEFKALKLIIKINNVRLQKLNASIEDKFEFGGCICKMN